MGNKKFKLTYALKNGVITSIDSVERGLKCGCVCAACGEQLVAKKGSKMMHHFAHYSGSDCEYGYETSLHLAAKEILAESKKIVIPPVYVVFKSDKRDELISEAKEISIDSVELEKTFDNIVPDVVLYAGGKKLFVEIYVTHSVDAEKLKKIQKADISTLEIDLSKKDRSITREELTELLINECDEKKWKYNAVSNRLLNKFYSVSDKMKIVTHGAAVHVDNCPIKSRVWRGKPYANLFDDCWSCEYHIGSIGQHAIWCSGRERIARLKDFNIPAKQRKRDSDEVLDEIRESCFYGGTCPFCGHAIRERKGKYGDFWGCSNYPHCEFTAYKDPKTGRLIMNGLGSF